MLRPLPFRTFGEIAALGLELTVHCSSCSREAKLDPTDERLRHRCFAGARLRCTAMIQRYTRPSSTCGQPGYLYIRPRELLAISGSVSLALLFCRRCVPYWQIDHVQLDKLPWSATRLGPDDRFRCPACRGPVDWQIHGPMWRPTYSRASIQSSPSPRQS
jgi:hypothetical protein